MSLLQGSEKHQQSCNHPLAGNRKETEMRKMILAMTAVALASAARADCWMTFCKTPGGQQYSQVGYVKPDADGFVTIKVGPMTVVVYKTQVWYQKMPGKAPL